MVNICLIGCGGVGRRHLEAILKVKYDINIEVVEPNIESIKSTKELLPDFNNYFNKIDDVSDNIDICLIATTANVRKQIIVELLSKKSVKFIILEKVVFQSEDDFDDVINLFEKMGIKSWVNCHLRALPLYKKVKSVIDLSERTFFKYYHSHGFKLSTSAIHVLDLFCYLCNDYNIEIEHMNITTDIVESKHKGCIEFNGNLRARSSKGHILSIKGGNKETMGEYMTTVNSKLEIKSSEGDNPILNKNPDDKIGFVSVGNDITYIPYVWQSSLTNSYINDIIEKNDCDLSTLEHSAKLHKIMLKSFRNSLKENYNREVVDCPIT
tara:strand:+ start:100 stop:1071 length:972 start_codon:yes stop_codon:yes gene_type:complete